MVFVGGSTSFFAYPASGGAPLWTFPVSKAVDSSPAVYNGVVYFASANGTRYALSAATGAQIWHVLPKAGVYAFPAITGPAGQQVLITGNLAGNLYALSPVTGATLWTRPGKAAYWSSPTVSQGIIYHEQERQTADLRARQRLTAGLHHRRSGPGAPFLRARARSLPGLARARRPARWPVVLRKHRNFKEQLIRFPAHGETGRMRCVTPRT